MRENRRWIGRKNKQKRTLALIQQLISQGKRDEEIRELATGLVQDVPEGDWQGELQAIIDYIKNEVRYTRDPNGIEAVSDANDTLELGYGDCDDYTVLAGSMLESIGHPVRLKIVGRDQYSHIFPEVMIKGKGWQPVDCARPREKVLERRSWPLEKTIELNDFGGNMPTKIQKQIKQARSYLATMAQQQPQYVRVGNASLRLPTLNNAQILTLRKAADKPASVPAKAAKRKRTVAEIVGQNERLTVPELIERLNAQRAQRSSASFILPTGAVMESKEKPDGGYGPDRMKYDTTGDQPERGFGDFGGSFDLTTITKAVTGAANLIPGGAAVTGMVDPAMIYGPKAAQRATRYGLTIEEAYNLRADLDKFEKAGVTDPAVIRMGWDQYNAKIQAGYKLTPAPKKTRSSLKLGQKYKGKSDNTLLYVGGGLLSLLAIMGMGKKK